MCIRDSPSPVSTRSKCVIRRRSRRVKAPDRGSLLHVSRHLPEKFVDQCGRVGGRGLSGVIARMNALCRGSSQPGTHAGELRPSAQRSSLRIRISVIAALTDRVSCCAPAALLTEAGKGRVAMLATYFKPRVTYARRTEASCLASAAASVAAIAAVRA